MSEIDFGKCISGIAGTLETPLSHVDPFYALRYQFGMLLGVEDFETEQAYHRGKMRLHNAWLHRDGVVWGLGIGIDLARGELRVEPGLALDAAGHELHLDRPACLSIPAWYEKNKDLQEVIDEVEVVEDAARGTVRFNAWVAMRFRACLTREVPALTEPCEGDDTDTAFSRVAELAELSLVAGDPPPRAFHHHRLRVAFGLESPGPGDEAIGQRAAEIRALPADQQRAAWPAFARELAALDLIDLTTALQPDGTHGGYFPGNEQDPVVLARVTGITLVAQAGGGYTLAAGAVDLTVRPTLLSTSAMQELLFGRLATREPEQAGGPRVTNVRFLLPNRIILTTDAPLAEGTVVDAAFEVRSRPPATTAAAWTFHTVAATLGADKQHIELTPTPPVAAGDLARIIARGTGPEPILGVDDQPLQDFTTMLRNVP